jgi:hypothetical protein
MGTLKIERQNYTIENLEFSDYLIDMTAESEYFVEIKQNLQEVFTEFFMSESFKTNDNTEGFRMLHYSLNKILDELFTAHNKGKARYIHQQLDEIRTIEKDEPLKQVF